MRLVRRTLFSGFALCLVLWVTSNQALAQSDDEIAQARQHFGRGVELFQEGDYEAALADFTQAYELAPHYALLYNVGLVHAHLHRYPEAVSNLRRYLDQGGAEIDAGRRSEVERELRRLSGLVGQISLDIGEVADATIYIDGVEVATTPLEGPLNVAAGRRRVEVRAEGHLPFRREVIIAGGVEVDVRATLVEASPQSGAIIVALDVPGATISLDGEVVGTTPLEEPIVASPGRHVIEATRAGYRDAGRVVEVELGEFQNVELQLTPLDELPAEVASQLELEISEPDTEVFIDGAPHEGGPLPAGQHLVEIRRAGFRSWWAEVELEAGDRTTLEAELRPTQAYLERYQRRARRWRLAASLTLGVGVALLGTNLGLYLWNRSRHLDWVTEYAFLVKDALEQPPTLDETESRERYDQAEELGHELETWSTVMWAILGVGIAALGTGVALFATGPNPRRYIQFSAAPGPNGFMVGATATLP